MTKTKGSPDSNYYKIALLDPRGKPTGIEWDFPRVTHILDIVAKPALYRWYFTEGIAGVAKLLQTYGDKTPTDAKSLMSLMTKHKLGPLEVRDAKADLGKKIHGDLKNLCLGNTLKYPGLSTGVCRWWQDSAISPNNVVAAEQTLVSFRHQIAGTPDIIYRDPATDELVLADLKTGSTVPTTAYLQLAAYKLMWEEIGGGSIDKTIVVHCPVNKPGTSKVYSKPGITEEKFLAVLALYRALEGERL